MYCASPTSTISPSISTYNHTAHFNTFASHVSAFTLGIVSFSHRSIMRIISWYTWRCFSATTVRMSHSNPEYTGLWSDTRSVARLSIAAPTFTTFEKDATSRENVTCRTFAMFYRYLGSSTGFCHTMLALAAFSQGVVHTHPSLAEICMWEESR